METNQDSNYPKDPNQLPDSQSLPDYSTSLGGGSKYGLILSRIVETIKSEYHSNGNNIKSSNTVFKNAFYYYALQSILKSKCKANGEINYDDEDLKQALIAINNGNFDKYLLENHGKLFEKAFYFEVFSLLMEERSRDLDKLQYNRNSDVEQALSLIKNGDLDGYIRANPHTGFEPNFFDPII